MCPSRSRLGRSRTQQLPKEDRDGVRSACTVLHIVPTQHPAVCAGVSFGRHTWAGVPGAKQSGGHRGARRLDGTFSRLRLTDLRQDIAAASREVGPAPAAQPHHAGIPQRTTPGDAWPVQPAWSCPVVMKHPRARAALARGHYLLTASSGRLAPGKLGLDMSALYVTIWLNR